MKRIVLGLLFSACGIALVGMLGIGAFSQTPSAPTVDRVGFPTGYQTTFKLLYTFDNYQNRQIRRVYGNAAAASVRPGDVFNFPYGSIILFESYTVQQDANGEPVLDNDGRFIPATLTTIFVMRKEKGFGVDYGELRTGEWEYVGYRPDGSYANPPATTAACALCHLTGGPFLANAASRNIAAQRDYVFRNCTSQAGRARFPNPSCSTICLYHRQSMRRPVKPSPFTTTIRCFTGLLRMTEVSTPD